MLNLDLARALDELAFAADCGLPEPDRWQEELLTERRRKVLLLCARQTGKSTATALVALHEATYVPGSLILLVSPSLRQSSELFRRVIEFWSALPNAPEAVQQSVLRLELENGSRVIALPGSEHTTRGYSAAGLVVIDEAARVSDELLGAVRPILATSNGRFLALSTPAGKRGWFHEAWTHGEGWQRFKVLARDCPRISAEFLEEERRELGDFLFTQEYECEFLDDQTAVFSTELIDAAVSEEVLPLWPLLSQPAA
jgi:hypothetical protein